MKKIVFLLFIVLLSLLVGCSINGIEKNNFSVKDKGSTYSVEDIRGKKIVFTKKPCRIVSCFVFADEILLDLVDHSRIAGMDKWIHDEELSSAVKSAEDIKTIVELNTESIVTLRPDLVLLPETIKPELVAALEDININVYVYKSARLLKDIEGQIKSIAEAVGEQERGKILVEKLNKDLVQVRAMKKTGNCKEKALLFLRFGAIGGEGTIYHDVLTTMGFYDCYNEVRKENAVAASATSILSKEEVIKANPDLLLMALWTQGRAYKDCESQLKEIYEDPGYAVVNAVKNKRAYIFPQRYINCLSHHAGRNILELNEILEKNKQK